MTPARDILAIDNGSANGAAALLHQHSAGFRLVAAVWWGRAKRGGPIVWHTCGPDAVPHPTDDATALAMIRKAASIADVHIVEAVHGGKVRGRDIINLAENSGRNIGLILAAQPNAVIHRPTAQRWRAKHGVPHNEEGPRADVHVRRVLLEAHGLDVGHLPSHVWDACGMAVAHGLG